MDESNALQTSFAARCLIAPGISAERFLLLAERQGVLKKTFFSLKSIYIIYSNK